MLVRYSTEISCGVQEYDDNEATKNTIKNMSTKNTSKIVKYPNQLD